MRNHTLQAYPCTRVLLVCAAMLGWAVLVSGCSSEQRAEEPLTLGSVEQSAPTALQKLIPFPRDASAASTPGQSSYVRNGASFAVELATNNVTPGQQTCEYLPDQAGVAGLADAAYAAYRLRCYREAATAFLEVDWASSPPVEGACWIGLSDWQRQRWEWCRLPLNNQLGLDPQRVASETHQCFVVVLVTGGEPVKLDAVRIHCDPDGLVEYTLMPPQRGFGTFLIDRDLNIAKRWMSSYMPNSATYLLDNGHMLRTCTSTQPNGSSGRLEEYDWDLNLVWYFDGFPAGCAAHHDIAPLPNGNILAIVNRTVPANQAVAAGKIPEQTVSSGLVIDGIVEIKPLPGNAGEIVWQWDAFDHLIQDYDDSKENHGVVAEHPELLDVNFDSSMGADFSHANSIDYNLELDQIIINFHSQNEFYIIDHSTTTAEAAGHTGGRYGRGGDFLYRWGNPQVYQQGSALDCQLFKQHDAQWIAEDCPGAGHILVFNNGLDRPGSGPGYSTVVELIPPLLADGSYAHEAGAYGPAAPVWVYTADPPESVYSGVMGGVQRLPDGNTLICVAMSGLLLEVTTAGERVWEYLNPYPYAGRENPVFKARRYYLFAPEFPVNEG